MNVLTVPDSPEGEPMFSVVVQWGARNIAAFSIPVGGPALPNDHAQDT